MVGGLRERLLRRAKIRLSRVPETEAPKGPTDAPGEASEAAIASATEPASPRLTVVMPVFNVEQWLDDAISSVIDQSFGDFELIIVNDGSTDSSAEIVDAWAGKDSRIVVRHQANAGLGAARNVGIELARGEYLAFVDSDDLVLPGAYRLMVHNLDQTGSDFVIGSFYRGNERRSYTPDWAAQVHVEPRLRIKLDDHPAVIRDIMAWNKVFRRSWWDQHEFRFPEGVRYEDQALLTRLMVTSDCFDVLDRPVYMWRLSEAGGSITSQKGSIQDLTDRLTSMTESFEYIADRCVKVQDAWFAKWLGFDFLGYFEHALEGPADGEYPTRLREALSSISEQIRPAAYAEVPVYPRLMSWLLINEHRELAEELLVFNQRHHYNHGWPVTTIGSELHVDPPLDNPLPAAMPRELTRISDADRVPRTRLSAARWDQDTLVLEGFAFLAYVDAQDPLGRTLAVRVIDDSTCRCVDADLSEVHDPTLHQFTQRPFGDHAGAGFVARIDVTSLSDESTENRDWRIEVVQRRGALERLSGFDDLNYADTTPARTPRLVAGRMVRQAGGARGSQSIRVDPIWSRVTATEAVGPGRVRLSIEGPEHDPLVRAFILQRGERTTFPPQSRGTTMQVEVDAADVTRAQLRVRHKSKASSLTSLSVGLDVAVDTDGYGVLTAGSGRTALLSEPAAHLVVTDLDAEADAIRVRGRLVAPSASRMVLASGRTVSAPSEPFGPGEFDTRIEVTADPWGLGRMPLPDDSYELRLADSAGQPVAGLVTLAAARRDNPFGTLRTDAQWWTVSGGETRIGLRSLSSAPTDRGAFQQHQLRLTSIAARSQPRTEAVLFECFYGRSVGDSPRAICAELIRRGSDLDLVWGIKDASVVVPAGARGVIHHSAEWFDLLGRARYVVASNNFPFWFAKAPDQVMLQTWHGTPLKKIGHDIIGANTVSRAYLKMMDASAAGWDQLISPSPYCSEIFPGAFAYQGPLLEVGYPRNDVLVSPGAAERRAVVRQNLGIAEDHRVVLYAPTWRDTVTVSGRPAKQLYLDAEEVTSRADDVIVLVRGHANTADGESVGLDGDGRVKDVTLYPDIADLYLAADVLVTDYSSVMFDFALLDRPIHLLMPDLDEYRDCSRGFYFDITAMPPGEIHTSPDTLLERLVAPVSDTAADVGAGLRAAFREKFNPMDDGQAASRVVDAIFGP